MPAKHASTRPRAYHGAEAEHGHNAELIWEVLLFLACMMFLFGSICFLDGLPEIYFKLGEWQFIVASLIYVAAGVAHMRELFFLKGDDALNESEFREQFAYLVSAIIFAAGTILFDEGVYVGNEDAARVGEVIAAWLFVIGSLGFVIATFYNAVTMSKQSSLEELPEAVALLSYKITVACLFCSMMGSVLFTTGSYLYQPNLSGGCKDWRKRQEVVNPQAFCVRLIDQGTIMYIIGSCFYICQSSLSILKLIAVRRAARSSNAAESKVLDCLIGEEDSELSLE